MCTRSNGNDVEASSRMFSERGDKEGDNVTFYTAGTSKLDRMVETPMISSNKRERRRGEVQLKNGEKSSMLNRERQRKIKRDRE